MGFLNWLVGDKAYDEGSEWAETVHASGAEVVQEQVYRMAEDLGQDPDSFYAGFRETWNAQPNVEPERGFWSKLFG